jgi:5'-methylthioadenosine phosphorylase
MCYALIALPSDYDCWRPHKAEADKQALLKEIIANLQMATDNCLKLIKAILESDLELVSEGCHCRKRLDLAVWTDPAQIDPAEKDNLKVLFQ